MKILVWDIETAPILAHVWGLYQQDIAIPQIEKDRHLLAWSAVWLEDPPSKIIYRDQRKAKSIEDDSAILRDLWKLLDEADIVITQNGKEFDSKVVNARFAINKMPPPSPYRHIDTKELARRNFAFTSNKLEYLSGKLCKEKKSQHKKFPGFLLWKACLEGNKEAWKEMEHYNKQDVLATRELYYRLAPWGIGFNLNAYRSKDEFACHCGSTNLMKQGFKYTTSGKFQQYQCRDCKAWLSESGAANNLLTEAKRRSIRGPL